MAIRPQPYRFKWPWSASQVEGVDESFQILFKAVRTLEKLVASITGTTTVTTVTTVAASELGNGGTLARRGRDGEDGPLNRRPGINELQSNSMLFVNPANSQVGIGTIAPSDVLDVVTGTGKVLIEGTQTGYNLALQNNTAAGTTRSAIAFRGYTTGVAASNKWVFGNDISNTGDDIFFIAQASALNALTINQSRQVGINISAPAGSSLTVQSDASGNCVAFNGRNNAGTDECFLAFFKFNGTTPHGYIEGVSARLEFYDTGFNRVMTIASKNLFVGGGTVPTARLHISAGTATASTAPLKFNSGTNLTTAEAGAVEYNGTNLFFTRAGTVRENVLVAIDNVAAPSTGVGVAIVNFYGASATNYLGDPNRWLSVNVLGSTYKIPLYN